MQRLSLCLRCSLASVLVRVTLSCQVRDFELLMTAMLLLLITYANIDIAVLEPSDILHLYCTASHEFRSRHESFFRQASTLGRPQ